MKTDPFSVIMRVVVTDMVIILAYGLLVCVIESLEYQLPDALFITLLVVSFATLFFALFFSNARLFSWIENDRIWSLAAGFATLSMEIPMVIFSIHTGCLF